MKTQNTLKFVALTAITAVALFAGCKKQEGHSESDGRDHTGHEQAKAEATPKGPTAATAQTSVSGAKCGKHNAPKELCFMCDASLREKGRLWCKEHSLYEDECLLCHPELKKKGA